MGPGAEAGSGPFAPAVSWRPVGQCALGFGGLGGAGHGSAVAGSLPLMSTLSSEEFICFHFCSFALMENMFFISDHILKSCCMILQYTGKQKRNFTCK